MVAKLQVDEICNTIFLPLSDTSSRIAQVQFQHELNLFASHPLAFLPTSMSLFRRHLHSEKELEEIGTQIPH